MLSASLFLLEEEQVPYDVYVYTYLCTQCVFVLIYAYTYVKIMYVTYVDGEVWGVPLRYRGFSRDGAVSFLHNLSGSGFPSSFLGWKKKSICTIKAASSHLANVYSAGLLLR